MDEKSELVSTTFSQSYTRDDELDFGSKEEEESGSNLGLHEKKDVSGSQYKKGSESASNFEIKSTSGSSTPSLITVLMQLKLHKRYHHHWIKVTKTLLMILRPLLPHLLH